MSYNAARQVEHPRSVLLECSHAALFLPVVACSQPNLPLRLVAGAGSVHGTNLRLSHLEGRGPEHAHQKNATAKNRFSQVSNIQQGPYRNWTCYRNKVRDKLDVPGTTNAYSLGTPNHV